MDKFTVSIGIMLLLVAAAFYAGTLVSQTAQTPAQAAVTAVADAITATATPTPQGGMAPPAFPSD